MLYILYTYVVNGSSGFSIDTPPNFCYTFYMTIALTEKQFTAELNRLSAAAKRAYLKCEHWRKERLYREFDTPAHRYAVQAADKWWDKSVEAGNALSEFQKKHVVKQ